MASDETAAGAAASPKWEGVAISGAAGTNMNVNNMGAATLLAKHGLEGFHDELKKCSLRSTFVQALNGVHPRSDTAPIKPRCRAGMLLELVNQRRQEGVPIPSASRAIHAFTQETLQGVLNFQPAASKDDKLELPMWINEQQPWPDDRKARRKRLKSKKRRKRRHRDDGEARKKRRGSPDAADDDPFVLG